MHVVYIHEHVYAHICMKLYIKPLRYVMTAQLQVSIKIIKDLSTISRIWYYLRCNMNHLLLISPIVCFSKRCDFPLIFPDIFLHR